MSLTEAWTSLIYKAATGTRRVRTLLTPVGLIIFGAFTTLFVLAALLVDRLLGFSGLLPVESRLALSFPLAALGIALIAWSAIHFLEVKGTPVPMNPPRSLVTTGPYRYARNPMLTGVFLLLLGIGFWLDSPSLVCFFTPLYALIHALELKKIEEPELEQRLGREYIEYRMRTAMFFPRIGKKADDPS
jgi:protein-S-isoprenylcysteine O-methyltransferase Ste14